MADNQVTVAPVANPAGLGLVAFGMTTILLSLINAGVLPKGGEPVVIPLALAFGGLMQIFAGAFEFRLGNTFGTTAFLSYGAFWWWFALLLLLAGNHWIDISAAGPTVGVALLLWGVLTLYLWVSTFRLSKIIFLIFLTLWPTFGLLGLGAIQANESLGHLGGWLGLVCGCSRSTAASVSSPTQPSGAAWCRWAIRLSCRKSVREAASSRGCRLNPSVS